jgi:hypothetical protein
MYKSHFAQWNSFVSPFVSAYSVYVIFILKIFNGFSVLLTFQKQKEYSIKKFSETYSLYAIL